eukprot:scaffold127585_cov51-Phaeocystis_antarctica.AAC.2
MGARIAISARSTSISRKVMQRRPTATVAAPANNDLAAMPSQLRSQAGLSAFFGLSWDFVGLGFLEPLEIAQPAESVLHVGDQFLNTGNDYEARNSCPCLWIVSPTETKQVLKHILVEP